MRRALLAVLVLGAVTPAGAETPPTQFELTFTEATPLKKQPVCDATSDIPVNQDKVLVTVPRRGNLSVNGTEWMTKRTGRRIYAYVKRSKSQNVELRMFIPLADGPATIDIFTTQNAKECAVRWKYDAATVK